MEALVASHAEEEELGAITKVSEEEEKEKKVSIDEEEEVLRSKLMVKFLGEILQDMRSVTERLLDGDPVMERYLKFTKGFDDVMFPYKELHRNQWQSVRQLSIMEFFHPGSSTSDHLHPCLPILPILHPLR